MLPPDAFIVNQARWLALDTVYLLTIRSGVIAGARVGGQLTGLGDVHPSAPEAYAHAKLLARWLATDPTSPDYVSSDPKNFVYASGEILEARLSTRRARWTGPIPNSGSIVLVPRSGRKRRLILLGRQDVRAVHGLLAANGVPAAPLAD